jgi:hypothetical protein
MDVEASPTAPAGTSVPLRITIANTGSGHNFPTGFPEGRIAWLAVHAYDLSTGSELPIADSRWHRTSIGVGNLTRETLIDPNFPGCHWKLPPGSADPYALQFKAVATLGDGCPTLELPYATPVNLVTNRAGLPIDANGRVIDATNPAGLPQFRDLNHNGDFFDDSFLRDTRYKPMPHREATISVDRYSVVIPPGTRGPVAVSASVYYQSVEAVVALKFLGNLADTNGDFVLEPCVLGGLCDGRKPTVEPAVVEGSPPVPMIVRNSVIAIAGASAQRTAPAVVTYPAPDTIDVYPDVVVKTFFSEPVRGVNSRTFTLRDSHGNLVPSMVDQIGDGAWGLFAVPVLLNAGQSYTARLQGGICDMAGNCTSSDLAWRFRISPEGGQGTGDTSVPTGFVPVRAESLSRPAAPPLGATNTPKEKP